MTVRLKHGDKRVALKLGGAPEFVVAVDNAYLSGKIGLYTEVDNTRQQVSFRNLSVRVD